MSRNPNVRRLLGVAVLAVAAAGWPVAGAQDQAQPRGQAAAQAQQGAQPEAGAKAQAQPGAQAQARWQARPFRQTWAAVRGLVPGLPLGQLGLTEQQRQDIRAAVQGHQEQMRSLLQEQRKLQQQLQDAVAANDVAAIEGLAVPLGHAQANVARLRAQVHAEVLSKLTADQQAKAKQIEQQRAERRERAAQRLEQRQQQRQQRLEQRQQQMQQRLEQRRQQLQQRQQQVRQRTMRQQLQRMELRLENRLRQAGWRLQSLGR